MSSAETPPDPDSEPISPPAPATPPPASPFASPGSLSRLGISPFTHQFSPRGGYGERFGSPGQGVSSPLTHQVSPRSGRERLDSSGRDTSPFTHQRSPPGAHGDSFRSSERGISRFTHQRSPPGAHGDSFRSSEKDVSPFTHQLALRGAHDERPGSSQQDAPRDSRDVLARRLADLAERVSGELGDEGVTEMHRWVDELEDVMPAGRKPAKKARVRPKSLDMNATRDTSWGPPSPFALLRSGFSDPTPLGEAGLQRAPVDETLQLPALVQMGPAPRKRQGSVEDAARIAREAEQLNYHLATLITRLQARQEESEHIHALLIEKAERAAQRIIVLEEEVRDLTSTLRETTSDLSSLRIALKAIELQCPPPQNLDDDLRQSIQNWKSDWKRMKEARAARHVRGASLLSSPGTPW